LAEIARVNQLNEIEIYESRNAFQIRTWHQFGISTITFNPREAEQLRKEIEEWLSLRETTKEITT
jgi:hypothetical protein